MRVFISYAWASRFEEEEMSTIVSRVKRVLEQEYGLEVWQDVSSMKSGDVLDKMAKGIEHSDVVVLMLTPKYLEKVNGEDPNDNCRREFSHAVRHKAGRIIPIVLDEKLLDQRTWTGRFGIALDEVVFQPFLRPQDFENAMSGLNGIIHDLLTPLDEKSVDQLSVDERVKYVEVFPFENNFNPLTIARRKAIEHVNGTREDLLQNVKTWFATKMSDRRRVLVFLGPAGYGKSVLMAYLCHSGGMLKKIPESKRQLKRLSLRTWGFDVKSNKNTFVVGAAHFFKHDDSRANDVKTCFLSIANQLALIVPGFREQLEQLNKQTILKQDDLKMIFRQVIAEPACEVPKCGKMVVIMDALDEVNPEQKDELLEIITQEWEACTPKWLGLIVSSRPEDPVKNELERYKPHVLSISDQNNLKDLAHYLHVKLAKYMASEKDLEEAVTLLWERSEGLFLYASFIERTLIEFEEGSVTSAMVEQGLDEFPDGLDGVYRQYFTRFLVGPLEDDYENYQKLLAAMVVTRTLLTKDLVGQILDMKDRGEIDEFLHYAEQLIVVDGDAIRFIHKSMTDFLITKSRAGKVSKKHSKKNGGKSLCINVETGHAVLAQVLLKDRFSSFALGHLIYHLAKTERFEQVYECIVDFAWLLKVVEAGEQLNLVTDISRFVEKMPIQVEDVVVTLQIGEQALSDDPLQLASQFYGRIRDPNHPILKSLEKSFRPNRPWLKPLLSTLESTRSPLIRVFQGHKDDVYTVAMEGNIVVSGSVDQTVQVWNWSKPNDLPIVFEGHTGEITCVAIQGNIVVSGSKDGTIRIWDRQRPKTNPVVLEGSGSWITAVALQGDILVSGGFDRMVRIWNWQKPKRQPIVLKGHNGIVTSVAIKENEIVSGSFDKTVRVWNLSKPKQDPMVLEGHSGHVFSVATDGNIIASSGLDETIRVWQMKPSKRQDPILLTGRSRIVKAVAIQGDHIVSGTNDRSVCVWNWKEPNKAPLLLKGHRHAVEAVAIDKDTIVSAGASDKSVRVWNLRKIHNSEENELVSEDVTAVALDGDTVVSGTSDGIIRIWDWKKLQNEPVVFQTLEGAMVSALCVKDGVIASGNSDGIIQVWDTSMRSLKPVVLEGHTNLVCSIAMRDDIIVSGAWDQELRVWNWKKTKEPPIVFHGIVTSVAIQENLLISGSSDKLVRMWDLKKPEDPPTLFRGHKRTVHSVDIDGDVIVSGSSDRTVRLWNINDPSDDSTIFSENREEIYSVSISKNMVVSGSYDGAVRVWRDGCPNIGLTCDGIIASIAVNQECVIVGDETGKVHFLKIMNE